MTRNEMIMDVLITCICAVALVFIMMFVSRCTEATRTQELKNDAAHITQGHCRNGWGGWERC